VCDRSSSRRSPNVFYFPLMGEKFRFVGSGISRKKLGHPALSSGTRHCWARLQRRVSLLDSTNYAIGGVFMKFRKNLGLCAAAVLLAGPSSLLAQLSDLPIKAGLWETHVSVNHGPPVASQACFSAGTTLSGYLTATNKGAPGTQCSVTNKTQTAHGIAFDNACIGQSMSSKGHIDFQLPDTEHFSGTSNTTVTGTVRGTPVNMAIDKSFTAKFLSSDCGSVKPVVVPSSPAK
jgi:hypothetical protein